jgi:hypothetical protein
MDSPAIVIVDAELARRLEVTEGRANAEFVETRLQLEPDATSTWRDFDGTLAMFDGIGSPLTQTFGLGTNGNVSDEGLQAIEDFFRQRSADTFHEVCPIGDARLPGLLYERGYRPIEQSGVLFRQLGAGVPLPQPSNPRIQARAIDEAEADLWARVAARGWATEGDFGDLIFQLSKISARRAPELTFWAELDGQPIATGAMFVHDRVALLAGASTVPESRKCGAQRALLRQRLQVATDMGCTLAMMAALPGSASQRNAQRQGFHIAYTRTKWQKPLR